MESVAEIQRNPSQADMVRDLESWADELDLKLLKITGHDNAIVGLVETFDGPVIAYDREQILANLEGDGLTYDEAVEYFDFNIAGAYMGRGTPVFWQPLKALWESFESFGG